MAAGTLAGHDGEDLPGASPDDHSGRGAREHAVLLRRAPGHDWPENVEALRSEIPRLLRTAREVAKHTPVGLAAYRPPNSEAGKEARVYDFVGMMGLPLVPCHEFPTNAQAAFFPVHCLKDQDFPSKLAAFIAAGKPVLITDGLKARLESQVKLDAPNVVVLNVKGDPKSLLTWSQEALDQLRAPLLRPFKCGFKAPNRVSLQLYEGGSWVISNFNDDVASVELDGVHHKVPDRGWLNAWK